MREQAARELAARDAEHARQLAQAQAQAHQQIAAARTQAQQQVAQAQQQLAALQVAAATTVNDASAARAVAAVENDLAQARPLCRGGTLLLAVVRPRF